MVKKIVKTNKPKVTEAPVESVIPEEVELVEEVVVDDSEKAQLKERVLGFLQGRHKLETNDYERLLNFLS